MFPKRNPKVECLHIKELTADRFACCRLCHAEENIGSAQHDFEVQMPSGWLYPPKNRRDFESGMYGKVCCHAYKRVDLTQRSAWARLLWIMRSSELRAKARELRARIDRQHNEIGRLKSLLRYAENAQADDQTKLAEYRALNLKAEADFDKDVQSYAERYYGRSKAR